MRALHHATLLACAGLLLAATAFAADESGGFEGEEWMQGATGLYDAVETMKDDQRPMVVYFYADWCGYCRQFERELLGKPEVKDYLGEGVLTVRINPEKGAEEREIARYYGVRGYPTFFVHSGTSKTLSRVERMTQDASGQRLMTPEEFIDAVQSASSK